MDAAIKVADVVGVVGVASAGPALRLVGDGPGAGAGASRAKIVKHGDGGYIRDDDDPRLGGGAGGAAHGAGGPGRARRRKGRGGAVIVGEAGGRAGGEREWNAAVYLTSYPVPGTRAMGGSVSEFTAHAGTVATKDKADRAHQVRNHGSGLLSCALDLEGTMTRPRRYPAHQMTSRGVAFDSAFDELHSRQIELGEKMGCGDLGGNWARRSVGSVTGITMERAAAEAAARGVSLRDLTRQRLNEPSMGDTEESAEAYARRQIALYKRGEWVAEGGAK